MECLPVNSVHLLDVSELSEGELDAKKRTADIQII